MAPRNAGCGEDPQAASGRTRSPGAPGDHGPEERPYCCLAATPGIGSPAARSAAATHATADAASRARSATTFARACASEGCSALAAPARGADRTFPEAAAALTNIDGGARSVAAMKTPIAHIHTD